MYLRSLIV